MNVQPVEYWVDLFAQNGFKHDLTFDATFIAPQAMRFKRMIDPPYRMVLDYERALWRKDTENRALREALHASRATISQHEAMAREFETRLSAMESDDERRRAEAIATLRLELTREMQTERADHEIELANAYATKQRLIRDHATALSSLHRHAANLELTVASLSWVESSRGVRLIKLARASREVLRRKGMRALARQVARWMVGKRGYFLSDLQQLESPRRSSVRRPRLP